MNIILIDADAFHCARGLGLVDLMTANPAGWPKPTLHATGIIARNELNDLQDTVAELEALELLRVEVVLARTPAAKLKREIQTKERVHKGEAEAIAWASDTQTEIPIALVSHDRAARAAARRHGLLGWDLLDLAKHWLDAGLLDEAQLRESFASWEEGPHVFGRPADFDDIDGTFQRRFGLRLSDAGQG